MPTTSGRIFVAIAVSKPGGGLAPLPGAITAAERMAAWAEGQGYNTLLLHDGSRPEITVELLREKITQAINEVTDHTELKRLGERFSREWVQSVGNEANKIFIPYYFQR